MTFLCMPMDFDCMVSESQPYSAFDGEFTLSSAGSQRIRIRSLPTIQIEIAAPRRLNQIERDAMDRAFWRSVTVLDAGSEG